MQKHLRWISFLGVIVVAVGGVWLGRQHVRAQATDVPGNHQEALTTAAPELAKSVRVVTPRREKMARYLTVPATMQAYEEADLYAKASGYISEVRVDIGDRVKAGEVLAIIDVPEMVKELAEAEAQRLAAVAAVTTAESKVAQAEKMREMARSELVRAQAERKLKNVVLDRRRQLFDEEAITQEQLDEALVEYDVAGAEVGIADARIAAASADIQSAKAALAAAEANVAVARARIERIKTLMQYAQIVAPFDGVVTRRLIDRGALVQSATTNRTSPLFTVHRTDLLRISIEVPESDIEFIQPGCSAKIAPYGLSDFKTTGKIARVATSLKVDTRTMRAEIDVLNDDGRLMSGMYAQVVVEIDAQANALTIPASSLLTEGHEAFVYTVENDRAVRTPVRLGLDDGIRVQVTEGLSDDDQIVVTGKGLISEGTLVRAVPMEEHVRSASAKRVDPS